MYLKRPRASTDPQMRSLLQKAVRRGADRVVRATVRSIMALKDRAWLRSRAVVITFEEAWPLAQGLVLTTDQRTREVALLRVSRATKQKDAAGLGALAFAFHEGDQSMLDVVPSDKALHIVSEGLDRRDQYFDWALSQCPSLAGCRVIGTAREYLAAATWGWDKCTILAGAFLATSGDVPTLQPSASPDSVFPYWIALDKHTPEGKETLRRVARECGVTYRQLIWAGFYCESAVVDAMMPSAWFDAERTWRLRKTGLDMQAASELWSQVRPVISAKLSSEAARLRARVEHATLSQGKLL